LPIIDLGQPRIDLADRNKIRRQPSLKRLAHRFRKFWPSAKRRRGVIFGEDYAAAL
jgi:hypothetical protein